MPGEQAARDDDAEAEPAAVVGPSKPRLLRVLGPGLITGASDDDPSGIATYSQVGAQFGYALGWTLLFSYPLMVAIQIISARIGRTTGRGIAGVLRQHYSPWLLHGTVTLLLLANTINLGADLGAMADAMGLLLPLPRAVSIMLFAGACIYMQVFLQYTRYVALLKWLALALFAYLAALMTVHLDWRALASGLTTPKFSARADYLTAIVAIFGTTISPYLFFWQSAEEVEDMRVDPRRTELLRAPDQGDAALRRIELDTFVGMAFSNIVALAILVTTAATLHASNVTDVQTSAQAAEALRSIAGNFSFAVFALGIIGTGLLAVPVLAGSGAYALGEALRWPRGFSRRWRDAKAFYATVILATLVGMAMNFAGVNPIKALFWSAVLNGIVAVPVMVTMMRMAARPDIMGRFAIGGWLYGVGWAATLVMGLTVLGLCASVFLG